MNSCLHKYFTHGATSTALPTSLRSCLTMLLRLVVSCLSWNPSSWVYRYVYLHSAPCKFTSYAFFLHALQWMMFSDPLDFVSKIYKRKQPLSWFACPLAEVGPHGFIGFRTRTRRAASTAPNLQNLWLWLCPLPSWTTTSLVTRFSGVLCMQQSLRNVLFKHSLVSEDEMIPEYFYPLSVITAPTIDLLIWTRHLLIISNYHQSHPG